MSQDRRKTPAHNRRPHGHKRVRVRPQRGRPSEYNAEIAAAICAALAEGQSLRAICKAGDMPCKSTVFNWLAAHEEFREPYARARAAQAEHYIDEILEIADDTSGDTITTERGERHNSEGVARAKLRIDTRKWLMGKLAPKKYGDRLELGGAVGIRHEDALAELE